MKFSVFTLATVLLSLITAPILAAAPVPYALDREHSTVAFTYRFGQTPTRGFMQIQAAEMLLDLDQITRSSVTVTLNPATAQAGFAFATQAMRGPDILDVRSFPLITFRSREISGSLSGAKITGSLTIRDVTRPITLTAELYRQRGTEPGNRQDLTVLLTGQISRAAFGADGWTAYVGDRIDLKIIARIQKRTR